MSLLAGTLDDEDIGPLVVAGLVSAGRLDPWGNRVTSARGLTFTTTVRVIDGVHRDTAVGGANTLPAITAGLADGDVLVVGVADLADGRHALDEDLAGLARWQLEQSVFAFLGDELDSGTGGAGPLRTLAGTELDVGHRRTGGDALPRKRISGQGVGVRAAHDGMAGGE